MKDYLISEAVDSKVKKPLGLKYMAKSECFSLVSEGMRFLK